MSLVGKIFSVLALILAVFYVGITTALVSLQENYRKQMVNQKADYDTKLQVAKQDYGVLEHKYTALGKERKRLNDENSRLLGENRELRSEWAESAAVNRVQMNIIEDQEKELARRNDQVEGYRTALREKVGQNDRLDELIAGLNGDKKALQAARDEFQDRLTKTENDRENALKEIEKLTEDLTRHVQIGEKIKAERPDVWAEAITRTRKLPPKQAIRGKVTAVDTKLGLVVINAGQRHDVQKDYAFIVFRGDRYIGRVVVDEVFPDVSAAHYVKEDMKADVEVGDDVTTKLVVDF